MASRAGARCSVDRPPCIRQTRLPLIAGARHGTPLRLLLSGERRAPCAWDYSPFFSPSPSLPPMVDWADNGLPALVTVTRRRSARPCFGSASGLQSERHRYAETGQRLLGCLDALPFVAEGWPRLFAEPQIYSAGRKRATRCGVCIRSCVRLFGATGTPEPSTRSLQTSLTSSITIEAFWRLVPLFDLLSRQH